MGTEVETTAFPAAATPPPEASSPSGLAWAGLAVGATAAYAIAAGVITLVGWFGNVPRLTDWKNDGISMFPNPAVCVVLCGVGLLLIRSGSEPARRLSRLLGGFVALIGGLTLLEHLSGVSFGIDTLVVEREWGQRAATAPMRMGPPASTSLLLAGIGLILSTLGPRARRISPGFGLVIIAISMLSIIGHLYGARGMYTMPHLTAIALPTASILLAVAVGLVASTPDCEPMRTILARGVVGMLARRSLAVLVVLSIALGWVRVTIQEIGWVDTPSGTALRTLVEIVLLSCLVWVAVRMVRGRESALRAESMRSEERRALLAAIVHSSDDAIVSKTLEGIITSWNPGAERIFGYTQDEARGQPVALIIPPDRLQEEVEILRRLRRGERIEHFETVRRAKSGRLLDVSLTVSPIRDASGRIIGASKIARDITQQKRIEVERAEGDRRKDEFIAILAHELRNPLGPIRNAAHYLKLEAPSDPNLKRPVEIIERQVGQMARLIDDLLDVSRISRGTLELRRQPVQLSEILDAALDACRHEIDAKHHSLQVTAPNAPIELVADRERLIQVLCNVLGNAAKYTPANGSIALTVRTAGDAVEISVKDSGVGIAPEKLEDIFELFTRVDASLDRQGGMGIGLTLARQLVEMHGGTIEGRSQGIGLGSEFLLHLPIESGPAVSVSPLAEAPRKSPALRILLADDNHDAVESLALLLELSGHEVQVAMDGAAAIAAAARFHPDVALLDIGMPKANGYEVADEIRRHAWGRDVFLVALTGWGQQADKDRAHQAGFDAHLVKPVPPEALEHLLADVKARVVH